MAIAYTVGHCLDWDLLMHADCDAQVMLVMELCERGCLRDALTAGQLRHSMLGRVSTYSNMVSTFYI